jgi:hypothetical protein
VPDRIRLRTTRGMQSVDSYLWYRGRRDVLEEIDRLSCVPEVGALLDMGAVRDQFLVIDEAPLVWKASGERAFGVALYMDWWLSHRRRGLSPGA